MKEIMILGTKYLINFCNLNNWNFEENANVDIEKKIINILLDEEKLDYYSSLALKHEIIHAYFYESGLFEKYGTDEVLVDWLALQFDKINNTIKEII